LLSFFTLIGWAGTILVLVFGGYIGVHHGIVAMLGVTILVALMSKRRDGKTTLFEPALRILLPCTGILLLKVREGTGNSQLTRTLTVGIGELLLLLLGFFVMFRGRIK
jgi:hypothetical protein